MSLGLDTHVSWQGQTCLKTKKIRRFWANSADRPRIFVYCNQIYTIPGTIGWIRQKNGLWLFLMFFAMILPNNKTSNCLKFARMAPISMIFARNRSRRPDLFFESPIFLLKISFLRLEEDFRAVIVVDVVVKVYLCLWGFLIFFMWIRSSNFL